jgi:hypothetical protein
MDLHLIPTHPDRCAGLPFLGKSSYSFGPILFAQGAMLAGLVASRVLYRGESLLSFKLQIAAFIAFFVLAILGPLLMFNPKMAQARRKGLAHYGLGRPETFEFLGFKHVCGVDQKGRFALIRIPSAKRCRKSLARTREWILHNRH